MSKEPASASRRWPSWRRASAGGGGADARARGAAASVAGARGCRRRGGLPAPRRDGAASAARARARAQSARARCGCFAATACVAPIRAAAGLASSRRVRAESRSAAVASGVVLLAVGGAVVLTSLARQGDDDGGAPKEAGCESDRRGAPATGAAVLPKATVPSPRRRSSRDVIVDSIPPAPRSSSTESPSPTTPEAIEVEGQAEGRRAQEGRLRRPRSRPPTRR